MNHFSHIITDQVDAGYQKRVCLMHVTKKGLFWETEMTRKAHLTSCEV